MWLGPLHSRLCCERKGKLGKGEKERGQRNWALGVLQEGFTETHLLKGLHFTCALIKDLSTESSYWIILTYLMKKTISSSYLKQTCLAPCYNVFVLAVRCTTACGRLSSPPAKLNVPFRSEGCRRWDPCAHPRSSWWQGRGVKSAHVLPRYRHCCFSV